LKLYTHLDRVKYSLYVLTFSARGRIRGAAPPTVLVCALQVVIGYWSELRRVW